MVFGAAVSFHLLDHTRQHGFRAGDGVSQYQLIFEDAHQLNLREAEQLGDQAQYRKGEEEDGRINQNHQLGQRHQRGKTEVGNRHCDQRKHTDWRVAHDHVSDFEHRLGHALEGFHQIGRASCRERV